MSNVVRLVSGGSIQVRTGVIQGIGPQGPRGVAGPQGPDGEQGPVGDTGPQGQILQLQGLSGVATNNPLSSGADTVIAFGSVSYDDLSAFTSTSNITLTAAGDYLLSCWLRFDAATATKREMWFQTGASTIARKTMMADTGIVYCDLAMPFRAAGGEVVNVHALAGVATGISMGSVTVTRVGSGPPGPAGPVGPQGPIGATGAAGPTGPAGSASTGFSSYALLLPH